ncbi:unnamed protein product, partial [Arabidopsis halleri]
KKFRFSFLIRDFQRKLSDFTLNFVLPNRNSPIESTLLY